MSSDQTRTLRDLGFKPYDGPRRDATDNGRVLFWDSLKRAWRSVLVKFALAFGGMCLLGIVLYVGMMFLRKQMSASGMPETDAFDGITVEDASKVILSLQQAVFWVSATLISLGAGSTAVAHDSTHKLFYFYFSKPVSKAQYIFGRVGAVALLIAEGMFIIGVLGLLMLLAVTKHSELVSVGLLFIPLFVYTQVVGLVMGLFSVVVSSLHRSKGVTISLWLLVLFLPHMAGAIVGLGSKSNVGYALSLPKLFEWIGNALFGIKSDGTLGWVYAVVALLVLCAASTVLLRTRLNRVEVVT